MKPKKTAGRPIAIIDWGKVGRYLQAQCKATGIATLFGISTDTLYKRCKEDNNVDFTAFRQQKEAEGKELLRMKLFDIAMNGSIPMGIWLSKQYLGFKDQVETTLLVPQVKLLPYTAEDEKSIAEAIDTLENETDTDIHKEPESSNE